MQEPVAAAAGRGYPVPMDGMRAQRTTRRPLCLLLLACSTLAVGAPQEDARASDIVTEDLIPYRTLVRADFKSPKPPAGGISRGDYTLAAVTCVHVRAEPPLSVEVRSITGPTFETRYQSRIRHVHFQAFMDRACSWWNPSGRNAEYTLQHEQIHFAIVELATRRLNEAARRLASDLRVSADGYEGAVHAVRTRVAALFDEASAAADAREAAFDEETSLGEDEVRQGAWWRQIERELADAP